MSKARYLFLSSGKAGLLLHVRERGGEVRPLNDLVPMKSEPVEIETPPQLLPLSRRLSPLQELGAQTFDFSDNRLDDNYTSRDDMIQDVQDYTCALDVDADNPAELHIPVQATPVDSLLGRVSPRGTPSSSASIPAPAPETAPVPAPAPAAPQATATGTNCYAMNPGVTRAVTRSQVRSSVATDYRANRNNLAAVPGLLHKDRLKQVYKLGSPANLDMTHQLNDAFRTKYAHTTINTKGNVPAAEIKGTILNTFKLAMGLLQAARRKAASDGKIARPEKRGVYELVPITAVTAGQRLIGTQWVKNT